jgi:hypothetical protein
MTVSGVPRVNQDRNRVAMNLTEKSIGKLATSDKRQHFYDDELTGFGVRVESKQFGGRKSFFWRAKVNGQVRFRALARAEVAVRHAPPRVMFPRPRDYRSVFPHHQTA